MSLQLAKNLLLDNAFIINNLKIVLSIIRFKLFNYEKKLSLANDIVIKFNMIGIKHNSCLIVVGNISKVENFILSKYSRVICISNEVIDDSDVQYIAFESKNVKDPSGEKYIDDFIMNTTSWLDSDCDFYYDKLYISNEYSANKDGVLYDGNIEKLNFCFFIFKYVMIKYIRDFLMREVITKDETYNESIKMNIVLKRRYRVQQIESRTPNVGILTKYRKL